jgi:uncharacterized protein (TIGR02391 family)
VSITEEGQVMPTREKPPRPWDIDDLLDIGKRSAVIYLKAVPVLILEAWVRGEREEQVANFVRTNNLARRLVHSGLVSGFGKKGTSNIVGALSKIQSSRNLTRPPLIEYQGGGMSWINLPHYEPLLQEYRRAYRERYREDYDRLFPEDEPEWERRGLPEARAERSQAEPTPVELEARDEVHGLFTRLEQALRERDETIEGLKKENQELQAELAALRASEHRIVDEELRSDCVELLRDRKYYIDAIRRASVVLETRLREAIGGTGAGMQYGAALVHYALDKDSGRLIISEHPTEQDGVHALFSGAFAFVRNPPAHKKLKYTEVEAWQVISLIDYLLSLLRQAKPREGLPRAPSRTPT